MIDHCKFCQSKIPVPELGADWWCPHCRQYSIACLDNGVVESETLRSGNFYMTFFPVFQTASIVETKDNKPVNLKNMSMNELTHEQAVQWVNKLKTYVLFS
jgi:hypothetical protein